MPGMLLRKALGSPAHIWYWKQGFAYRFPSRWVFTVHSRHCCGSSDGEYCELGCIPAWTGCGVIHPVNGALSE